MQELPDGFRTLNDATRIWRDGRIEQLGWPRVEIDYRPGTRHPEHAVLHLTDPDGKPVVIEVDTLGFVVLHAGAGYGGDPDCTQCGCMASVGLGALGDYKLGGVLPLRAIFNTSFKIGDGMRRLRGENGNGHRPS